MGKRIYWALLIVIAVLGLTTVIYYGIQPRPIPKIKLSRFATYEVLADSLLLRLREEIHQSPVLFLGVEASHPEHFAVWKAFLTHDQEMGYKYDLVVMDQFLQSPEFPDAQKVPTKEDVEAFSVGIQNALKEGKRVAVIVPTVYSVQAIPGNFAHNFKERTQIHPMSLSLTDFPRTREQEKDMIHPCVVEGVDQTGEGPFGCTVVQAARANYRKRYQMGDWVGLVNQIGMSDYLILYTQEK